MLRMRHGTWPNHRPMIRTGVEHVIASANNQIAASFPWNPSNRFLVVIQILPATQINRPQREPNRTKQNVEIWSVRLMFHVLKFVMGRCRLFGLREDYAETLHLCRTCGCLFWKSYGHPCLTDSDDSSSGHQRKMSKSDGGYPQAESFYVPVPPQAFLKFFSL